VDVGPDARVETVWTLLRLGRLDEGLAELEAARPTGHARHAEIDVLEVMLLLERCDLPAAQAALEAASARHDGVLRDIDALLAGDLAARVPDAVAMGIKGREPKTKADEAVAIAARRSRLGRMLRRFAAIRDEQRRANALPLDFRESAAGKMVKQLVDAAVSRTEKAVGEHLRLELEELREVTGHQLGELEKLRAALDERKKSGC
jgi:hypothetical protein